jgi:outer membrane biosynthesis protein TonB
LLVVLDAAGEARHVWLLRSCGVPALDTAARRAVQLSRFGTAPGSYRGVLRVVWAPAAEAAP